MGWFVPAMAALTAGASIYSAAKGGGGGGGGYSAPRLSKMGKWAQSKLYGDIERALGGGGLISPDVRARGYAGIRGAYRKGFPQAEAELESQLNRLVPREDVKVRGFARGILGRQYAGTMQGLREQEKITPYEEQQEAIGQSFEALAGEKRMSLQMADAYNDYIQRMAQLPTFGSQLGYGLGRAGGWAASGAQKYAQGMSGKAPTIGGAGVFTPARCFVFNSTMVRE